MDTLAGDGGSDTLRGEPGAVSGGSGSDASAGATCSDGGGGDIPTGGTLKVATLGIDTIDPAYATSLPSWQLLVVPGSGTVTVTLTAPNGSLPARLAMPIYLRRGTERALPLLTASGAPGPHGPGAPGGRYGRKHEGTMLAV